MNIVENVHDPRLRRAFRLLLGGCGAQLVIFWTVTGGQWVYAPYNVMTAIPIVGGAFGNLINVLINLEVDEKAKSQARTIVIETMAQLKQEKENETKENGNQHDYDRDRDGTNG